MPTVLEADQTGLGRTAEVDYTGRLGLFSGPEFTRADGWQYSVANDLTESGFIRGESNRHNGASGAGKAAWVANAATGTTIRIGLFSGAEFTRADGWQESGSHEMTEAGFVLGLSNRYDGTSHTGTAAWVADAATGTTTRIGFFSGAEFTQANGRQYSAAYGLTESGFIRGGSERYDGSTTAGSVAWVAEAATGITTRIGLFGGAEFTRTDGWQRSVANGLTESGFIRGESNRFNGSSHTGMAAWVANAATGTTTRIGLFSGPEFTFRDGSQNSFTYGLTESGFVHGLSRRYNDWLETGDAAWVANAATGTTTRIGLFSGAEFTRADGRQYSAATDLTEAGFVSGISTRYNGSSDAGRAAWVADAAAGTTTRIGFFSGAEFTHADGYQYSSVDGLMESGFAAGTSARYDGPSHMGIAAWVADAATGTATRIGLFSSPEFTHTNGHQRSYIFNLAESGFVTGISIRYHSEWFEAGHATWVADAATGTNTRIGLFSGAEFTHPEGFQGSSISRLTESGFVSGTSVRYNGSSEAGQSAWVADASTGITAQTGVTDDVHTAGDGYQYSMPTLLLESGFALGYSHRYNGDSRQDGQTAWIFDTLSGLQTDFVLSVRPSDGYAYSILSGMTSDGLAFGSYRLFDGETLLGDRAFVWSGDSGIVTLDEAASNGVTQDGWENFLWAQYANGNGYVTGTGSLAGGGQGVYLIQIPEPSSLPLALLAAAPFAGFRRRRQARASMLPGN